MISRWISSKRAEVQVGATPNRRNKHAASVATPIGNLSDISARALQTLRDCDLIAAEDTRVTRALLNHFEIETHQHNEENRAAPIVARMLEEDLDVALVTDAGTPCISDPGSILAKEAAAAGIEVLAVRGRRRLASALSVSGLTRGFAVYGFLPRQKRRLSKSCWRLRAPACRLPSRTSRRTA